MREMSKSTWMIDGVEVTYKPAGRYVNGHGFCGPGGVFECAEHGTQKERSEGERRYQLAPADACPHVLTVGKSNGFWSN